MTRIDCHQLAPRIGELAVNQRMALAAITASAGADLIILPELVTSGYMFNSRAEADSLAVPADSDLFTDWSAAVQGGGIVIGGFAEQAAEGNLYNSAVVLDRTGVLAIYRKTHLWDNEKLVFTPGDQPPPLLDTRLGRIGVLICYDLEFPEMTRALALAGADLIAAPTNWPLVARPAGERPPEVTIAMAAARVNRICIACSDRAGGERGQDWTEGTAIIDENGWVVATAGPDNVASADLDLTQGRNKVLTPRADVFADRRPDLYSRLDYSKLDPARSSLTRYERASLTASPGPSAAVRTDEGT